jgi:mRNA interferase YafQ
MRTPVHTGQFRRETSRAERRGKDMSKLRDLLSLLIAAEPLPPRLKDHPLTGDWGSYRDCHIEPDWLLLYKIDGNDLILARTGPHADLFR